MNQLLEALAAGEPRVLAAALVMASLFVHTTGAILAWRYRAAPESRITNWINRLGRSTAALPLLEMARFVYYVGVPYGALFLGWLDLRAMGLGFLDWADGLRWTIVLILAAWSLLMFVWVPYLRATRHAPVRLLVASRSVPRRVLEVIYMQAHWTFYRAACISILALLVADQQAMYWGTSAGVALVLLEAWADPRVRRKVAHVGEGELALWSAGQAIINAVGFVLTRNVWLLAVLQLALEFGVPHLRAAPRPLPPPVPLRRKEAGPAAQGRTPS